MHWPFISSWLRSNSESLALMASASSILQLGLLLMRPLQWLKPWVSSTQLASQMPPCQGEPGLRCSSGPLKEPSVDVTGHVPGHGLQKECGLDRCLQLRFGGDVQWKTGLRPLVAEGRLLSHQLPGNAPLWRNQHWFVELTRLLTVAPWPIPLRQNLLSQANGTIWHPRPELWMLHLWPLDGSSDVNLD